VGKGGEVQTEGSDSYTSRTKEYSRANCLILRPSPEVHEAAPKSQKGPRLTTTQHTSISPDSESAQYSLKTALDWFELQYKLSNGKAAPKNINTMSPFYCLGSLLLEQKVKDQRWTQWCDEWAEWIMNDLPRTKERGFQHSESRALILSFDRVGSC
jgi:unsaturated rhamnogalacturonyl hydrolase